MKEFRITYVQLVYLYQAVNYNYVCIIKLISFNKRNFFKKKLVLRNGGKNQQGHEFRKLLKMNKCTYFLLYKQVSHK